MNEIINRLTDNMSHRNGVIFIKFANFQFIDNINKLFSISYNLNGKIIIIVITANYITINDNLNKIKFVNGKLQPILYFNNYNLSIKESVNNDIYNYSIFSMNIKIADIYYNKYGNLLNSMYFDKIYLKNCKTNNEEYQKIVINIDDICLVFNKYFVKNTINDILDNYYKIKIIKRESKIKKISNIHYCFAMLNNVKIIYIKNVIKYIF